MHDLLNNSIYPIEIQNEYQTDTDQRYHSSYNDRELSLNKCKYCNCVKYCNYKPNEEFRIVCLSCCIKIRISHNKIIGSLIFKKIIYQTIIPKIHEEILEIGMHPDRIYQSQLFDTTIWGMKSK
jgi:hypothetical protein